MPYHVSPKQISRRSPQVDSISFPLRNSDKFVKPTSITKIQKDRSRKAAPFLVSGRSERLSRIESDRPTLSSKLTRHYPGGLNERIIKSDEESTTSQSDLGWGTETGDEDDDSHLNGKGKTQSSLEKAESIINQIGDSWKSDFNNQVGPIKSEFKNIADQVENMMLDEAQLAKSLGHQLEIHLSDDREVGDHVVQEFGGALESAVKINDTIRELQKKIKGLNERMKKKKEVFINDLAALKIKNQEEVEEFKDQLSIEAESIPAKIQEAKSTKVEQKQVQLKLAKILAHGLH